MDLTHRFSVPASVEEAWRAFNNLEALAPCIPGATITNLDGDAFTGSMKVKVGSIPLVYIGSGSYVDRGGDGRRVVIEARGEDRRGNGTATATVTASFIENGDQTDVEVVTDLAITGRPAQFGRGVISDVSDKLLDQFVNCVSGRFGDGLADWSGAEAWIEPTVGETGDSEESVTEQTVELGAVPEEIDGRSLERARSDADSPEREPVSVAERTGAAPALPPQGPAATPAARPSSPPKPAYSPPTFTPPSDTSQPDFDVLATIGRVGVKRLGPALALIAVLIFITSKIIKRNR